MGIWGEGERTRKRERCSETREDGSSPWTLLWSLVGAGVGRFVNGNCVTVHFAAITLFQRGMKLLSGCDSVVLLPPVQKLSNLHNHGQD